MCEYLYTSYTTLKNNNDMLKTKIELIELNPVMKIGIAYMLS